MSDKHTPGPWQVILDEHPHRLGGTHKERRIFTAWDHPQMRGPIGVVNGSLGVAAKEGEPARHMVSISEGDARLIAAAPELLRELKHLVSILEPLELVNKLNVPGLATLNGARAAIAKATRND